MSRKSLDQLLDLGQRRNLIEVTENHIEYVVQNKRYKTKPEERVRAAIYVELVEEYSYSPARIDVEVQVPRRTPSDQADIVVFADDDHKDNYLVVETKPPEINQSDFSQAIEQGFGNANSLRAKYLVVDSFRTRSAFDVGSYPANERKKNQIPDIPNNYGLVSTYRLIRGGPLDLRRVSFQELASRFQACHNILWSGGKLDPATAFDEMSKLLFAKICDERTTPNGESYRVQVGNNENEVIVGKRCVELYEQARAIDPAVFTEPITVSDAKIRAVVETIEEISLSETDLDAKGQAFEKFLDVVFRGGLGQYFTRRQIVEFVVEILDPKEEDIILDPSCGSGGFLLYAMNKVASKIQQGYAGKPSLVQRKVYDFTRRNIYGIEINAKIARVAIMDMIVNDDGHTNIENNTGLNSNFANPGITFGRFTLIMTNPPFGVRIKRDDRDNLGHSTFRDFEFGGSRKKQVSDILFLEQYKKFLVNDVSKEPRVGVVLHAGVLNNPTNKPLLKWLRLNFMVLGIVALPDFAFRKAGSGMKTCLVFLRKYAQTYRDLEDVPDYDVFFAVASHIGYDSTLRPDRNDLSSILMHYKSHTEDRSSEIFWIPLSQLEYRLDPVFYSNKFAINEELGKLRKAGHKLLPLRDLLAKMNSGKSPEGGVTRSTGEVPSVTITNITKDGGLDFEEDINFVPGAFWEDFNSYKGELKLFDILIAKDGATTGKTAIVDETFPFLSDQKGRKSPKAIFSEHVFRLRTKTGIYPLYLHAYLNSSLGQLQLETVTSGGAQGGITKDFADQIMVPVLALEEQKRLANQWAEGMGAVRGLRRKGEDGLIKTKREFDESIFATHPVSQEELDVLQGEPGEVED